jgi:hypothetical protein
VERRPSLNLKPKLLLHISAWPLYYSWHKSNYYTVTFFFFGSTQVLCLLGRHSTTWPMLPNSFLFQLFFGEGLPFLPGTSLGPLNPPTYTSHTASIIHMCTHSCLVYWDGISLFSPRLASNYDPFNLCFLNSWDYRCVPPHSLY